MCTKSVLVVRRRDSKSRKICTKPHNDVSSNANGIIQKLLHVTGKLLGFDWTVTNKFLILMSAFVTISLILLPAWYDSYVCGRRGLLAEHNNH
jgi:hypothetical protein